VKEKVAVSRGVS